MQWISCLLSIEGLWKTRNINCVFELKKKEVFILWIWTFLIFKLYVCVCDLKDYKAFKFPDNDQKNHGIYKNFILHKGRKKSTE
jgi:hypothetical protein